MDVSNVTIDIHSGKLLEWLMSRRHCQKTWPSAAVQVRARVATALQALPERPELATLLAGAHVHYFQCQRVLQLLRDAGGASALVKDWQEVLRLYEREDLFLAEAAQLLQRDVSYEIPALRRQIERAQRSHAEGLRKEQDQLQQAKELGEKLVALCTSLGVTRGAASDAPGVRRQLIDCAERNVPPKLALLAEELRGLDPALTLYASFNEFLSGEATREAADECAAATGEAAHEAAADDAAVQERCPLLRHIVLKGNSTSFEFMFGREPVSVEPVNLNTHAEDELVAAGTDDIDWDDGGIVGLQACDLGYPGSDGAPTADFDIDIVVLEDDNSGQGCGGDIDWSDIEIVQHTDVPPDAAADGCDGVARGELARSLLDNGALRETLLDELHELEAFLARLVEELRHCATNSGGSALLVQSLLANAPVPLRHTDAPEAARLLAHTRTCLAALDEPGLRRLLQVRAAGGHLLTRLVGQVDALAEQGARLERLAAASGRRAAAAAEEVADTQPRLDRLRGRTRELAADVEAALSAKYKGRPVHIVGEISTIG